VIFIILGCYAHTLNIAAQEALKVQTVRYMYMIAKERRIVAFFHRSAIAANVFKIQADLLGIPILKIMMKMDVTRWNSAYKMAKIPKRDQSRNLSRNYKSEELID
jgi:hypothetical protein